MSSQNKEWNRNPGNENASSSGPRTLEEATITGPIDTAEDGRREPRNLQSLLKLALEAIDGDDPPQETYFTPMEDEKKKFLNEALNSLTVNIVKEIQKSIRILRKVSKLSPEDDPSEYENALEMITENVEDIDVARDFYRVGGFRILEPCLTSPHATIRWKAADLIAQLTQNNLFCQNEVLQKDLLPILLNMVDSDSSDQAKIKSLYAISCTVRGNGIGLQSMKDNDGYSTLMTALQSPVEKLKIKAAFLLSVLCSGEEAELLRSNLIDKGLIEQTIELLSIPDVSPEVRDRLLDVLKCLTSDSYFTALTKCRKPELCLRETLERHLADLRAEGARNEAEACLELLYDIFPDHYLKEEMLAFQ